MSIINGIKDRHRLFYASLVAAVSQTRLRQRVEVMQRQRDDERRQFTEEVLRIRKDPG